MHDTHGFAAEALQASSDVEKTTQISAQEERCVGGTDVGDFYVAIDRRKGNLCTECKNAQAEYLERQRWRRQMNASSAPRKEQKPLSQMTWAEKAEYYRFEQTVAWVSAMFDNQVTVVEDPYG